MKERGCVADALAQILATDGVTLPPRWTSKLTSQMDKRFQEWLLPVYGFSKEEEVAAASAAVAAAGAGAEGAGGGGARGEACGGGEGSGPAATPAAVVPGTAGGGPGPATAAAATTLTHLPLGDAAVGAATAPGQQQQQGQKRARCRACTDPNPVDPVHQCLQCGAYVHVFCGHPQGDEGHGQAVVCYMCKPREVAAVEEAVTTAPAAMVPLGRGHRTRRLRNI